ncbi:MAG: D-2-hydroxyacid dehydrogenase [Lachnospiraceae bacterium]|nr:D-2-hydroxyacid dehydrogenase [Lachnospiraceae bacterium]
MKIVFLDTLTLGDDIDLSGFEAYGELVTYSTSTQEEMAERTKDADIIVVNKCLVNEASIGEAKNLKLVCVSATGTNNLDKEYLAQRKIPWKNVAGYSTDIVAQHTFALLLYVEEKLKYYDEFVKSKKYCDYPIFTNLEKPFHQIAGATWGIIGLGNIGRKVAKIAEAFGAKVIYASASGAKPQPGYTQVDMDTLFAQSDIISVHAPLDEHTEGLINKEAFAKMKKNCILLNLGRGPIVVEEDLCEALESGQIRGAGIDVLCKEPMDVKNPLLKIKDSDKLIITPHIAWASVEARKTLIGMVLDQVKEFTLNATSM